MPPRKTKIETVQQTGTIHRISIGLISVSLGLVSLALASALFVSPSASFLFVPSQVSIQSAPSTATAVTLSWTAPGDNGNIGQAASYNLRYSTIPITNGTFDNATAVTGLAAPSPAGTTETATVINLQPLTTYYFALKTSDAAGNVSDLSNVATKTTSALAVACVPTYTCTGWTGCLSGIQTRTCSVNNNCPAGLDAPVTSQTCIVSVPPVIQPPANEPPPASPGTGTGPVHVVRDVIVAGLAPGASPKVRVIDPVTKKTIKEFMPFSAKDSHGVHVAAGDINGDSQADVVVGTGIGTDPLVKVFSITGVELAKFTPYPTEKKTGVSVAVGDVNGDGIDEIITVPAKSSAQVRVWSFITTTKKFKQLSQLFAYDRVSRQGFTVAAGDLNLDGRAEIVVAPRANGRSIAVLRLDSSNGLKVIKRIAPFPILFTSGLTITTGDVFGNGRSSIIVANGPNYYTDIKVIDVNGKVQSHFLPTPKTYRKGLTLTTQDVNKDGRDEIITGAYERGDSVIKIFRYSGLKKTFEPLQNYLVYPRTIQTGLRLGAT